MAPKPKEEATEPRTATVNVTLEEKIGLANYSNVVIRGSITRQVEDKGIESLREALDEISSKGIEPFLGEMRQIVLNDLKEEAEKKK